MHRFKGGGQAAGTGFDRPRWTEAQVVLLEGGMLAVLWLKLKSCSLFTRLSMAARAEQAGASTRLGLSSVAQLW